LSTFVFLLECALCFRAAKEALMFTRDPIHTDQAPPAIGPYSQAIKAGGFVFASGQIPTDPATGQFVAGGIAEQTEQVLKNLSAVLEAAGSGLHDVVKTTVFLADMGEFALMNEVYGKFFADNPPARATVEAARLPRDARVEIEAIAIAGK
jgi:2-iminobutanoate/2-iminopropanoate deaminase